MICPFCNKDIPEGSRHCVGQIGKLGGQGCSERKLRALKRNARKPRPGRKPLNAKQDLDSGPIDLT